MRINIEIVSKNWKKGNPGREDQFCRNEAAAMLRSMADRLSSSGASDARFDHGKGTVGTLEILED